MNTCETCRWWKKNDPDDPYDNEGTCHRNPPVMLAGTWGSTVFLFKTVSRHWPETEADEFCGDWEVKP